MSAFTGEADVIQEKTDIKKMSANDLKWTFTDLLHWTRVQLDFRTRKADGQSRKQQISQGANDARYLTRGDCYHCIQHSDDYQDDGGQRGSLCQRRLSSRLRSARARRGRTSRGRRLPLCYREWRTGSSLRITAKSTTRSFLRRIRGLDLSFWH